MELGAKLKEMRLQKNLTQEELADRCELTKGYISQLENDVTSPSIATLYDLLNALGSTLAEFFREDTEEKIVFSEPEYIEKRSDGMIWNWVIPNAQKNMMERRVRLRHRREDKHCPRGKGLRCQKGRKFLFYFG